MLLLTNLRLLGKIDNNTHHNSIFFWHANKKNQMPILLADQSVLSSKRNQDQKKEKTVPLKWQQEFLDYH